VLKERDQMACFIRIMGSIYYNTITTEREAEPFGRFAVVVENEKSERFGHGIFYL
jgi:hypothetical protein